MSTFSQCPSFWHAPDSALSAVDSIAWLQREDATLYVRSPIESTESAGLGLRWETVAHGPNRFDIVRKAAANLFKEFPEHTNDRIWGGFSFYDRVEGDLWAGFPAARWFLPAVCVDIPANVALHRSCREPALDRRLFWADQPNPTWVRSATMALDALEQGVLKKLVLARTDRVGLAGSAVTLLDQLRHRHLGTILGFRVGSRWFVTATPELLIRVYAGHFETQAVAGTRPRTGHAAEDRRFAHDLLTSIKERREHAFVVESILEALRPIAAVIDRPAEPCVAAAGLVQHLVTPIRGRLWPGFNVLDALERLHPTAAVSGYPPKDATTWLRQNEAFERGWYAAPVGWMDRHGNGAFWVAIRSALIDAHDAVLFAGAGFVPGSDPSAEWKETCLKLHSIRTVMGLV